MKLHIVTIGKPKLDYAVIGFQDYLTRLQRLHNVRVTHLADKYINDSNKILEAVAGSYVVVLEITGDNLSSPELAQFLEKRELESKEVSLVIGGPDGLPQSVRDAANYHWSLGKLTLPHDLAMVVTAEALYRASMIRAGLPYHR